MLRRVLAGLALAVVGLAAHYLVGANVLLASGLLRGGFGGPVETFSLEYDGAYSLVPGVVHVRGLHIRAQDVYTQWSLDADRARLRIEVLPLAGRVVQLSGIRVKGAVFRIRRKLDPMEVVPARARLLAPIRGYSDPPLRDAGPPPAPPPRDEQWTVELEDVDAQVRELWVQEIRAVGDARLTSKRLTGLAVDARQGVRLSLGANDFALGRSTFVIRRGLIRLGPDTITRRMHGRLVVSVSRFDLTVVPSIRLARYFSVRLWARGDLTRLPALNAFLAELPQVQLRGGEGDFDAHVVIEKGVLQPPTRVIAHTRELALALGGVELRTNANGRLDVRSSSEAVLAARLTRVRLSLHGDHGAPLWSDVVSLGARTEDLAIARGFADATLSASVPHAVLPDVAVLAPHLPSWLRMESGEVHLDDLRAHLSTARRTGTASGAVRADSLDMALGGVRIRGGFRAEARAGSIALDRGTARGSAFLELRGIRAGRGGEGAPLWGRLDASAIDVRPAGVTLPLTFRLRDADGLASAVLDRLDLPLPGFVSDWLDHEDVHGRAVFAAQPTALAIGGVDLRGDNYRMRGRMRLSSGPTQARLLIESGILSVGVGVSRGETDVVVFGASSWFAEESATRSRGVSSRAGRRAGEASRLARRR